MNATPTSAQLKEIIFDDLEEKADEPTSATTHPVTKTSEGEYTSVKQTNTTNPPMDVIEEE